jgi:hypothetical protein
MKPMLKFITALMDVTVDKPEGDVDQGCAKYASKNKGDDEIGGRHDRQAVQNDEVEVDTGHQHKEQEHKKSSTPRE